MDIFGEVFGVDGDRVAGLVLVFRFHIESEEADILPVIGGCDALVFDKFNTEGLGDGNPVRRRELRVNRVDLAVEGFSQLWAERGLIHNCWWGVEHGGSVNLRVGW